MQAQVPALLFPHSLSPRAGPTPTLSSARRTQACDGTSSGTLQNHAPFFPPARSNDQAFKNAPGAQRMQI